MVRRLLAIGILCVGSAGTPNPVRAYDMDCAILLCMAGSFPPSDVCALAYAEMIRRITPWPSLPPFGICTYTAMPVSLGGPGGDQDLDISVPEFSWLEQTHVIWWEARSYEPRDEPRQWDWAIRSCDAENSACHDLIRVRGAQSPWPATFTTENDLIVPTPVSDSTWYASRAVMVEYGDFEGNLDHSEWVLY